MDASLLLVGPEGEKAGKFEGEEAEVVKERFTSLPDGISASFPLKHGESISKSVTHKGEDKKITSVEELQYSLS